MHTTMPERRRLYTSSELRSIPLRLQQHRLQGSHMFSSKDSNWRPSKQHITVHPSLPKRRLVHAGSQLRGLLLRLQRHWLHRCSLHSPECIHQPRSSHPSCEHQCCSVHPSMPEWRLLRAGSQLRRVLLRLQQHRLPRGLVLSSDHCLQSCAECSIQPLSMLSPLQEWGCVHSSSQLRRVLLQLPEYGLLWAGVQHIAWVSTWQFFFSLTVYALIEPFSKHLHNDALLSTDGHRIPVSHRHESQAIIWATDLSDYLQGLKWHIGWRCSKQPELRFRATT